MKQEIVLLELFSGIGGFAKGLSDAGYVIKKHYFSEIDKHAIANYKYNYKNAEYIGSVTDVRGGDLERPNIITFGSPCQDFSLAGQRKGMEGQRSSLVLHAIRLITECRPDFFVWENVKGTFSSNYGADFWAIIKAFADIGGYRLEWQLLNTSWFLPQNRERIYLVGHLAKARRDWKGVFPFRESDFGFISRQPTNGSTNVRTIIAGGHSVGQHSGMTLVKDNEIARTDRSGGRGSLTEKHNWDVICVAQRGRNVENSNDRTTGTSTEQRLETNTTNTLTSVQKDNLIMINVNTKEGVEMVSEGDCINFRNPNSKTRRGRVGKGKAQTLDTQANQGIVITDDLYPNRRRDYMENTPTITSHSGGLKVNTIRRLTEIECERLQGFPDDWTKFGMYLDRKTSKYLYMKKKFTHSDLWDKINQKATEKYSNTKKEIPKTQRYKMCGNAVTVEVVRQIGIRLISKI